MIDKIELESAAPIPREAARLAHGRVVLNGLLASIPDTEFGILQPLLGFQAMPLQKVLNEPGERLNFVYFLNSGLASLMVFTSEGRSVEVGITGKNGFIGIPIIYGVRRSSLRVVVQIAADGYRITADDFQRVLPFVPSLRVKMGRYALLQGMQAAQTAACNRLHELGQRLARWLLMTEDRIGPEFIVTQEYLAQMLGTGRASVSIAASRIRRAGIIQYSRGILRVVNRGGLEELSCECYATVRQFNRELGFSV